MTVNATNNRLKTVTWPLIPALDGLRFNVGTVATNVTVISNAAVTKSFTGYRVSLSNSFSAQFYSLQLTQMNTNALLVANVLNRIAYGPTPDELERVTAIGPQAYITEQLNMETVPETLDNIPASSVETTNSVPPSALLKTNWINVTRAGTFSATNLYLYLTTPGEAWLDSIALYAGTGTNIDLTTNYIRNGGFESALSGPWTVSPNHAGSAIDSSVQCSGSSSLHMVVPTTGGTTLGSSIWQPVLTGMTNNQPCTLSYWYLPKTNSSIVTVRLSQNGIVTTPTNEPLATVPNWIYVTQKGVASTTKLYIYLDDIGAAYIDDLKVVAGTNAGVGPNLMPEGDFEGASLPSNWTLNPNAANSALSRTAAHSGAGSLRAEFTAGGSTDGSAIVVTNLPLTLTSNYTISYWYVPSTRGDLTIRLSGNGISTAPDSTIAGSYRRLTTFTEASSLSDLRAWFCNHAVLANRQLLETLSQFWENHFVTYHSKTVDFLDTYYDDFGLLDRLAANLEFREMSRWRTAMLNPQCTFQELLKISAESPAMIIYLDTAGSRGDLAQIANENYAREIMELFTMGVDNGYDQNDIVLMSRAWTGWTVRLVNYGQENNPFAAQSTTVRVGDGNTSISNLVGTWSFVFRSDRHGTNRGPIFPGKTVPARFGAPWAGTSYQLNIPGRPTGNTNGIQDGYDVVNHLANLPFTMEFISVKLCRLFVHDDFHHGVYDYTDPNRSPEAELVRQCMLAWTGSSPKGQLRPVLQTIFNSELFRSHGGSLQKVKTPFEFVASSLRALRSVNSDGTATAVMDGYSFKDPMSRMGAMGLFNRAEPDGYPEAGPPWVSAGTLAERLRFVQALLLAGTGDDAGSCSADPVALLKKKLAAANWNNAAAIADYFVSILFPGEGRINLDQYRTAAVNFLNTGDDGLTSSVFTGLSNTGTTYDTRVRGMVAMLMTFQRFEEQ
ncbi:MAG: hypothetical protein QOF48_1800 [Verrucomicrobiota bacterium]